MTSICPHGRRDTPTLSEPGQDPWHLINDTSPLGGRQPGALSGQIIQLDVLKGAWDLERKRVEIGRFKT